MKKIAPILIFTIILSVHFSCKKEPAPTREEFLAGDDSKTWKQKIIICDGQDVTSQTKSCLLDNLYTFYRSKQFQIGEGTAVCNPGDPSVKFDGYWSFDNKEPLDGYKSKNWIYFYETEDDMINGVNDVLYPFKIDEILQNKLKVSYLDSAQNKTYNITFEP